MAFGWITGKSPLVIISTPAELEAAIGAGMVVLAAKVPVELEAGIEAYRAAGAVSKPRKRDGKIVDGTGGNGYYTLEAGEKSRLPVRCRGMSLTVHGPRKDGTGRDSTGLDTGPIVENDAADLIGGTAPVPATRRAPARGKAKARK